MAIPPQLKASVLGGGVAVIDRIDGAITSEDLIARLTAIMENFNPVLVAARADHEERNRDRLLRDEQDRAYKESLAADREKERKRREEEERLRQEEEAARRAAEEEAERERRQIEEEERKRQEREMKAQQLPEEPSPGAPGVVTAVVRLSDGSRVQRRFLESHTMSTVYKYVETQEPLERWSLVTHFPKQTYEKSDATLKECGFTKQAVLFVQEILD
jgi:FAS-associated factor 2